MKTYDDLIKEVKEQLITSRNDKISDKEKEIENLKRQQIESDFLAHAGLHSEIVSAGETYRTIQPQITKLEDEINILRKEIQKLEQVNLKYM